MSFSERFVKVFRLVLPAPFTIAILLSVLTFLIAFFWTETPDAVIEVNGDRFASGQEVVLTSGSASASLWKPGGETSKSITVTAETGISYTLVVSDSESQYSNSATLTFTESNGDVVPVVQSNNSGLKGLQLLEFWETGMWQSSLLAFAIQMMLMLVLGHALALSGPVNKLITKSVRYCNNTANAAAIVTFLTVMISLFNWGLGLIFGAIFARKVAEHASANNISLNYAIVGAAGYSGLMVWHGGISGSSLAKVAEAGHIQSLMEGIASTSEIASLPLAIPFEQTVFSGMNILVSLGLLTILPAAMFLLGRRSTDAPPALPSTAISVKTGKLDLYGAERLDHSRVLSLVLALIILFYAFYKAFIKPDEISLGFITPNFINLVLLGLCLLLHYSFATFLKAIDSAIGGAAGILIQFPLYFGIMGIMKSSGLVTDLSEFFVSISNETTYPIFTFFSAGLVNVFVPSGGGQWMVQGPIIVQAATDLGVSLPKSIMALAYGDQITNMLQPFWALPLLGITGLKAKEILPYTLYLMVIGIAIFIGALLIF